MQRRDRLRGRNIGNLVNEIGTLARGTGQSSNARDAEEYGRRSFSFSFSLSVLLFPSPPSALSFSFSFSPLSAEISLRRAGARVWRLVRRGGKKRGGGRQAGRQAGKDAVENRAVPCLSLSPRCSTSLYKYSVMSPCQLYYPRGVDKKRPL